MSDFPATPSTFIPLTTGSKTRIFLHTDAPGSPPSLTQVTTLNADADRTDQLVAALNHTARTGDGHQLELVLAALPAPVTQSCREALDRCPDPKSLVIDAFGEPVRQIGTHHYFSDPAELVEFLDSSTNLGLAAIVTNSSDAENRNEYIATLLNGDITAPHGRRANWIAPIDGLTMLKQYFPSEDDLVDAFRAGAWSTYVSRCYWLWIQDEDDSDSMTLEYVMEHYDALINPEATYLDFKRDDHHADAGPVTPRNRFMLWSALDNICTDLDGALAFDPSLDMSQVRDDLPALVRAQPREWWAQLFKSAKRLSDAARLGKHNELVPRTVAEEALLHLATSDEYIEWARDMAEMRGTDLLFEKLPVDDDWDGDYEELLPSLTGDADIEFLWMASQDGIEDPSSPMNNYLGMGDYRPSAWHRLFDRAIRSSPDPLEE